MEESRHLRFIAFGHCSLSTARWSQPGRERTTLEQPLGHLNLDWQRGSVCSLLLGRGNYSCYSSHTPPPAERKASHRDPNHKRLRWYGSLRSMYNQQQEDREHAKLIIS